MKTESIFDEGNRLARDLATSWFKFAAVGDKVGGTIKDMFEKPENEGLPAQRCFTLATQDGEIVNVGLKRSSYVLIRTDNLQIGDQLGVEFTKEIPAKIKGFSPAKSLTIFMNLAGERIKGMQAKDLMPIKIQEGELAVDAVENEINL